MSISPRPSKGDIVLVDYPFSSGAGLKRRPAFVVQNDTDNGRLSTTIIAMISSNTSRTHQATQFLIDISTPGTFLPPQRNSEDHENLNSLISRLIGENKGAIHSLMSPMEIASVPSS